MQKSKERDKSKKRDSILEGAEDVFINMGFEAASMDKIAEQAGVSKRTVYNHFGSKENLFEVIVDNLLAERQNLNPIKYDSEKPLKDQLRAFAESEIFLIDSPRRLELSRFLTVTFLKDLEFQRRTVSKYPPVYGIFMEWLREAHADSKIVSDNLILTARVFYALVVGAITWPALFTYGIKRDDIKPMLDEIISVFLEKYGNDD
ncbi:MAG: TetR/AcrR family transcriptional regulator [Eubacteriales bacterium]